MPFFQRSDAGRGCRITESKITLQKRKSYESESFSVQNCCGCLGSNQTFEEVPTSVVKNANQFGLRFSNIRIDKKRTKYLDLILDTQFTYSNYTLCL